MKYLHKCPICNKQATCKYKKVYFCDACVKRVRKDKPSTVYKDVLVGSLGRNCPVYSYSIIKLV